MFCNSSSAIFNSVCMDKHFCWHLWAATKEVWLPFTVDITCLPACEWMSNIGQDVFTISLVILAYFKRKKQKFSKDWNEVFGVSSLDNWWLSDTARWQVLIVLSFTVSRCEKLKELQTEIHHQLLWLHIPLGVVLDYILPYFFYPQLILQYVCKAPKCCLVQVLKFCIPTPLQKGQI